MPAVIRKSVDPSAGHCFPPRPPDTGSPTVWVNWTAGGNQATRGAATKCPETESGGCTTYDHYPTHCCGDPCHDGCAQAGSSDVFVNCQPFHRYGDAISCGDVASNGSPNVFANSEQGVGFILDNSAIAYNFINTDRPPSDPVQPNVTEVEFHQVTNDDSTTEPDHPLSQVIPVTPIEDDQTPPPTTQPPPFTCNDVETLDTDFQWQDLCHESGSGSGPPTGDPPLPTCTTSELNSYYVSWANSFQLSTNFTLADLTINPVVSTYKLSAGTIGSQKEVLQNLCFLANTVLEPMLTKYGSFIITSCFRDKTGSSQHNKGQAVDIQYTGYTSEQYWNRAKEIRDEINYDQMILEYGGRNPWFHLSTNSTNHRHSVLTQTAPRTYEPGLIRLA